MGVKLDERLRVIRRKTWGKKGRRKKVTGQRSRGRVNVMGGVRYNDRKRMCYFIDKGTGDIFYEQLKQLNEFVKSEWIQQGNEEPDFKERGPKILIIIDNASYHKKKEILGKIENTLPNIQLYFLPPYSPDYNPIRFS
jgi:hypothetical protein